MRPSLRRPALSFRPHLLAASLMLAAPMAAETAAAQGTPRSMAECERLKNDLAYNQCLAMFGPPARNVASGGYVSGNDASSTSSVASTATIPGIPSIEEPDIEPARRRGRRSGRRGRASASFDVGSADAGAGESEGGSSRSRRRRR
ncbi:MULTISPECIES: hypothetical protein [Methylorubrum]|uniref:Uncharacterized protein n=1 Tax=Methylorubrum extorquens (strain CM4 / NCIMB 13688) TaxID=440085 RepID=B7KV78_METC4|nr:MULTISPECIES: hypothetical protein [Methylorubrum]ACK82749.1 conserved hypothetical protein [Methylorubrum extorquens CM4]MCY1641346.1 hypothetical protein [Methylorubrum sp. SL192]